MKHLAYLLLGIVALNAAPLYAGQGMGRYEVTVTNTTYGQVLTPPLIVVHTPRFAVFEPGDSASAALKALAERGNTAPLAAELESLPNVKGVTRADSAIPPGHSLSIDIDSPRFGSISVLGMLASTNDGFFAVQGLRPWQPVAWASAYDAGTEANTEMCTDIPGPPCLPGSNNEVSENAEGFIHVHRGFHGINEGAGDPMSADGMALTADALDWRGPVARITIRRKW